MRRVAELVTSAVKIQVPASQRVVNVIVSEKNGRYYVTTVGSR